MVLGEAQVLGQVKAAYRAAQDAGKVGVVLQQLFERTFAVARKVRSATGIGEHAVSVSYAAVELAKKIFESLSQCTAMVLGAGNTSELAVRHFVRQGVGRLLVTNRTPGRAEKLAQMFSAEAIPWTAFPDYLRQTDIVLSSTSAPYPILHKATVQEAMQARKGRPMFFIDLAVPRDVDPAINTLDNVFVYDLDALANVVGANRHERQRAALAAQGLIQREVQRFQQWLATQAATPTIVALRQHAESIRRSELDKTLARLRSLGERERQAIEALTVAIVNKLLHIPTVQLKRSTGAEGGQDCVQLVRHLFALDECVP
jgi:glutamyl-tRNA reductase